MKDQLISLETAKLAKEKGFKEGSKSYYSTQGFLTYDPQFHPHAIHVNNEMQRFRYEAPTQSLLQKWLRKEHKRSVHVFLGTNFKFGFHIHDLKAKDIYDESKNRVFHKAAFDTYEEALEQGLIEALKLIP